MSLTFPCETDPPVSGTIRQWRVNVVCRAVSPPLIAQSRPHARTSPIAGPFNRPPSVPGPRRLDVPVAWRPRGSASPVARSGARTGVLKRVSPLYGPASARRPHLEHIGAGQTPTGQRRLADPAVNVARAVQSPASRQTASRPRHGVQTVEESPQGRWELWEPVVGS